MRSSSVMADVTDLGVHELCLITDETPLYCLCQQGEYGLMVGCDGVACNIVWFHLQCVGLKGTPTTETWLCPGGGVPLGIFGGVVPPASPNPDPISDQKMPFPPPVFRPGLKNPYPFSDLTLYVIKPIAYASVLNGSRRNKD